MPLYLFINSYFLSGYWNANVVRTEWAATHKNNEHACTHESMHMIKSVDFNF